MKKAIKILLLVGSCLGTGAHTLASLGTMSLKQALVCLTPSISRCGNDERKRASQLLSSSSDSELAGAALTIPGFTTKMVASAKQRALDEVEIVLTASEYKEISNLADLMKTGSPKTAKAVYDGLSRRLGRPKVDAGLRDMGISDLTRQAVIEAGAQM